MKDVVEGRVGTIVGGKWRVDALLGSGSMAAVYAVTHRNGMRAALKILHPALSIDPVVCERFLGEGYLTNAVKNRGIVRVLDDGVTEDDQCVYLVMDLLEGRTLDALRRERGGKLPLREALDVADAIMDALEAVHAAGLIHRDLKPQNVFVCDDGAIKVLDFGIARVADGAAQSKLSAFGLVLGTPAFMPPEQAAGTREKVDHRSDIWSLGATLFTSLTGQTVHLGPNAQARLAAAATAKARSIGVVMPELPKAIVAAIDTALRFEREDRWQSVSAFRRALREARAAAGLGKPVSVRPPEADVAAVSVRPLRTPVGLGAEEGAEGAARASSTQIMDGRPAAPARSSTPPISPLARIRRLDGLPPVTHAGGFDANETGETTRGVMLGRRDDDDMDVQLPLLDIVGRPRGRSGLGVWIAAVGVVAAIVGVVVFFARHASSSPSPPEAKVEPAGGAPLQEATASWESTSAVLPALDAGSLDAVAALDAGALDAVGALDAGGAVGALEEPDAGPPPPRATASPPPRRSAPRSGTASRAAARPEPRPTFEAPPEPPPAPSFEPPPSPAEAASSDPFSTPE